MMGLIRPIAIKRIYNNSSSQQGRREGPPANYGMASDDHDEYDHAFEGKMIMRGRCQ
jgi:hypothetical protein